MGKIKAGVSKTSKPPVSKTSSPRRVGLRRMNNSSGGASAPSAVAAADGAAASVQEPPEEEDESEEDFSENESSFSNSDVSSKEDEDSPRKRKVVLEKEKKVVKKSKEGRRKDDLGSALRRNLDAEGLFKFKSDSPSISLNYCCFIGLRKSPEVLGRLKSVSVPASSKPVAALLPSSLDTNSPFIQGNASTPVSQNVERRIAVTSGISCFNFRKTCFVLKLGTYKFQSSQL
jgi:hypothetical protein